MRSTHTSVRSWRPLTRRTVTGPAAAAERGSRRREASATRWGLEEFADGIDSVAAPVRDARGKAVAADSRPRACVPVPPGGDDRVCDAVVSAGRAISDLLREPS